MSGLAGLRSIVGAPFCPGWELGRGRTVQSVLTSPVGGAAGTQLFPRRTPRALLKGQLSRRRLVGLTDIITTANSRRLIVYLLKNF